MKKFLSGLLFALAVAGAFYIGRRCPTNGGGEPPTIKVDTLYVRDTVKMTQPIEVEKRVVDSVYVPVERIVSRTDTLYVILDREQLTWKDSLSTIYVSGIQPKVDSVIHYIENAIITKEIPVEVKIRPRWSIGVGAGYGIGRDGLSPYIGVGITYNLLSW